MHIDESGWLHAGPSDSLVKSYPSVRSYRLSTPAPLGLVWHYTATIGAAGTAERLSARIQRYRRGIDRAASWHLLIARDGSVFQSAPFSVGTWHVGRPGDIAGRHFDNINRATIGCELENAGRLARIDGRFYCWPYWTNPSAPTHERRADPRCLVPAERAAAALGQGTFESFTAEQERAATALVAALAGQFGWKRDVLAYGHCNFDSPRKEDPGPLWQRFVLPRVLNNTFGGARVAGADAPSAGAGG